MNYVCQKNYVSQKFVFLDRFQNINRAFKIEQKANQISRDLEINQGFPDLRQGFESGSGVLELSECYKKHSGNYSHYKAAQHSTSFGAGITATPLADTG